MKITNAVSGIALLSLLSFPASATQVTFSDVTGTWQNVTLADVVDLSFAGQGTGHPQLRWGIASTVAGNSGYDFDAATPPPITVDVPPSPSGDFVLGTFTHVNQIIQSNVHDFSITGAQLAVNMDVAIGGVDQGHRTFLFDFLHDETPNNANPCPFGGGPQPCPDRVRVNIASNTESFLVDGVDYTVNVLGFEVGGNLVTSFLTPESADSPANLIANVSAVTPVSEPGSLLLLLSGLGMFLFGSSLRQARLS